MGRKPKADLTEAEWSAIEGLGNRAASGVVSAMRGANVPSITAGESLRRRVSHAWIGRQRAERNKTHAEQNAVVALGAGAEQNGIPFAPSGSRMGCEASGNGGVETNASVLQASSASGAGQVSEPGAAKKEVRDD